MFLLEEKVLLTTPELNDVGEIVLRRFVCSMLVALLAAVSVNADEAHDRGRRLLPDRGMIDEKLLTTSHLAISEKGKMVGWLRTEVTRTRHEKREVYRLKKRMVIRTHRAGKPLYVERRMNALLDMRLCGLRGTGSLTHRLGGVTRRRSHSYERVGKQLRWRRTETDKAPVSRMIDGLDLVTTLDSGFPRLLLQTSRGQRYELRSLSGDKGQLRAKIYERIGKVDLSKDSTPRFTVKFLVRKLRGEKEVPHATLYLDPQSGAVLKAELADPPIVMRPISSKTIARWQALHKKD